MAVDCQLSDEAVRTLMIEHLEDEVHRLEPVFLRGGGVDAPSVASWAHGLLEGQKAAMVEIVDRALSGR